MDSAELNLLRGVARNGMGASWLGRTIASWAYRQPKPPQNHSLNICLYTTLTACTSAQ